MEAILGGWIAPVLMIPGMALLTISTANRINTELLALESRGVSSESRRLTHLRHALTALYTGIAVYGMAGLLGGLLYAYPKLAQTVIVVMSCLGVVALIVATAILILEGGKPYEY